jgi:hypothetical protein
MYDPFYGIYVIQWLSCLMTVLNEQLTRLIAVQLRATIKIKGVMMSVYMSGISNDIDFIEQCLKHKSFQHYSSRDTVLRLKSELSGGINDANYFLKCIDAYRNVASESTAKNFFSGVCRRIQQLTLQSSDPEIEKLKKIAAVIMLRINGSENEILLLLLANSLETSA